MIFTREYKELISHCQPNKVKILKDYKKNTVERDFSPSLEYYIKISVIRGLCFAIVHYLHFVVPDYVSIDSELYIGFLSLGVVTSSS